MEKENREEELDEYEIEALKKERACKKLMATSVQMFTIPFITYFLVSRLGLILASLDRSDRQTYGIIACVLSVIAIKVKFVVEAVYDQDNYDKKDKGDGKVKDE